MSGGKVGCRQFLCYCRDWYAQLDSNQRPPAQKESPFLQHDELLIATQQDASSCVAWRRRGRVVLGNILSEAIRNLPPCGRLPVGEDVRVDALGLYNFHGWLAGLDSPNCLALDFHADVAIMLQHLLRDVASNMRGLAVWANCSNTGLRSESARNMLSETRAEKCA